MSRHLVVLALVTLTACAESSASADLGVATAPMMFAGVEAEAQRGFTDGTFAPDVEGRQLVRTGRVGLVVDDWGAFRAVLDAELAATGGFVGDATLTHTKGEVSWASLTVRVPSAEFDRFVAWAQESAEVTHVEVHSSDVTRQWVDLQSRIENGQAEETRLRELLAEQTGSLADVLAVERELARVRGEVEQAQREALAMKEQIDLSTIDVSVEVRSEYAPPIARTFPERIGDAFRASTGAMVDVAELGVLAGVAAAPWLTVAAGGLGALLLGLRRALRRV